MSLNGSKGNNGDPKKSRAVRGLHGGASGVSEKDDFIFAEAPVIENEYLIRLSSKFRVVKLVSLAVLIFYMAGMITVFSSDINFDSMKYLLKDLKNTSTDASRFDTVVYDGGSGAAFDLYRGDLAVVRPGSTKLYNSAGSLVLDIKNDFMSPAILSSSKYLLVYDKGDTSKTFSVCNSFAEVFNKKLDYPISGGDISDGGIFALITRSVDYKGTVIVYDTDFNEMTKIYRDKYVMDAKLSRDGSKIAVLTASDLDGDWSSQLMLCGTSSSEPDFTVDLGSELALLCTMFDDGSISVLTSGGLKFFSRTGEVTSDVSFPSSSSPSNFASSGKYAVFSYKRSLLGSDNTIEVRSSSGETVYSATHSGELRGIRIYEDVLFLLFEGKVERVDLTNASTSARDIEKGALDITATSRDCVLVCYTGLAQTTDFSENN